MRTSQLVLIVLLVSASATACARARAHTEPVMPVLAPPPPPPRIVEAYPEEPVPTITPGPLDAALATPPSTEPPTPPEPPEERPKPEAVMTEEPEALPANASSLTLKPPPGVAAQTEASIRALLDRASQDLQRVDYAALNADGRTQFEQARRFMQLSQQALKGGNLVYAGKLADKAATMAAVLVR